MDRQSLIIENRQYAEQVAVNYLKRRGIRRHQEVSAAISSAHLGLIRAARTFDPAAANNNFRAWAKHRIVGTIQDDYRERTGHRLKHRIVTTQLDPKLTGSYSEDRSAMEAADFFEYLAARLHFRQRRVLASILQGMTQAEIAREVGCSAANVSRILTDIKQRALEVARERELVP